MRARLLGAMRWLGGRRALLPLSARVLCAGTVSESAAFLARELVHWPGVHFYHLRHNGLQVPIRHGSVDAATLAEVFYHRYYEPPEKVAEVLGEPTEILDLGANIGLFGAFAAARWPAARVRAYEPDPTNAELHARTIQANSLGSRWSLVRAAAGAHDGEVRFAAGLDVGSHVLGRGAEDGAAIVVPMHDVLAQIAGADLVKMDIEGGEWEILEDPRFAEQPPRVLVMEYHPLGAPAADPRAAVEGALRRAAMTTRTIWHGDDGHGMLWAWRG